ncbi:unnamed protein product [Orchesella dallaii]|uniref:Transmembrane protein n=1 Tax=Orchesella dallaii TaxID=48710 RepID=A0ABP1RPH7_9HEXA
MAFNGYNKIFISLAGAYAIWMFNPFQSAINILRFISSQWKKLVSKKWYMSEVPSAPDYGWQQLMPGDDLDDWYHGKYLVYVEDRLTKETTGTLMMALSQAPERWYGRYLLANLYAPVQRESLKFFLALSIDYEAMLLGFCYGMFITFRKFLDYGFAKSPEFRSPGSVCSCAHNHFYLKHKVTRLNVRKLYEHDRRLFYKKIWMALPTALGYAGIAGFCCGVWNPIWNFYDCAKLPVFWGGILWTYFYHVDDYDETETVYDLPMVSYRYHPELQAGAVLLAYTVFRVYRNLAGNFPFQRVLYG